MASSLAAGQRESSSQNLPVTTWRPCECQYCSPSISCATLLTPYGVTGCTSRHGTCIFDARTTRGMHADLQRRSFRYRAVPGVGCFAVHGAAEALSVPRERSAGTKLSNYLLPALKNFVLDVRLARRNASSK